MKILSALPIILLSLLLFSQTISETKTTDVAEESTLLEADYIPEYYRLEINSNPYQNDFSGTTTMHFSTKTETTLIKLNADENLMINAVNYHGNPLTTYSREGNVLNINLPELLPENRLDSISVSFSGNAETARGYYVSTHNETPISYTISEPFDGSTWWVCKDDLLEKVSQMDIYITHPTEFKAASNGSLISVSDLNDGNSTTHWQHNYPIPVYLVGIAVSDYAEYNNSVQVGGVEMPIINYLYPETLDDWTYSLDRIPAFIEILNDRLGDYPYKDEKYGHAQTGFGGGMEHSTMSFMGNFSFHLTAHELAHQWFGNKVTCATWNDIWINEGFAEYCVGILKQEYNGEESFYNMKADYVDKITLLPGGSVYNPEGDNENRIFDNRLTYKKGAMAVHLIRYILDDDELFYQSLRDFLNNPEYSWGYAGTEDFRESLEGTTGMNWDNFFEDWIYGEGYPIFNISVNSSSNNNQVKITINQDQSHPSVEFFETPFEIAFYGSGNQQEIRKFNLTENNQVFHINDLPFQVLFYEFNPNFDIVCRIDSQELNNKEVEIKKESVRIYPNPAQDFFRIESSNILKSLKVYDMSGKLISDSKTPSVHSIEIKTTSWIPGTYLVQVQTAKGIENIKLLIK